MSFFSVTLQYFHYYMNDILHVLPLSKSASNSHKNDLFSFIFSLFSKFLSNENRSFLSRRSKFLSFPKCFTLSPEIPQKLVMTQLEILLIRNWVFSQFLHLSTMFYGSQDLNFVLGEIIYLRLNLGCITIAFNFSHLNSIILKPVKDFLRITVFRSDTTWSLN